jgi:predicted NBD/HSP70 family sugar kinase
MMTIKGELAEPTLCADVGASNVRAGVAEGARVTHLVERRTPDLHDAYGGDMVLALAEVLVAVQASAAQDRPPAAGHLGGPIGVGVPAIVLEGGSLRAGLSSGPPAGTVLRDRLSERFATPVVVENDARL